MTKVIYLVVGVSVPANKMRVVRQKRGCDHEFSSKFCPECGGPRQYEWIDWIAEADPQRGRYADFHWFRHPIASHDDHIIAVAFSRVESLSNQIAMVLGCFDMAGEKERLRKALEPAGLWNELAFGIHIFVE